MCALRDSGLEIESLRQRANQLDRQVKRLVRMEKQLFQVQRQLGHRVSQITALNKFALEAGALFDIETLLRMALEFSFRAVPGDCGVAIVADRDGRGALRIVAARGEPKFDRMSLEPPALLHPDYGGAPLAPQILIGNDEQLPTQLRTLVATAIRACVPDPDQARAVTVILPMFRPDGSARGLLISVKLQLTVSVHEILSTPGDLPFFCLFSRHIGHVLDAIDRRRELEDTIAAHTRALRAANVHLHSELEVRRRAESDLIAARDAAEAGIKAKAQFLANMSHEIRTPINGILGMVELLSSEHLSLRQRRYVDAIETCVSSLTSLVNDILDFSRIEAGYLEFDNRDFSLRKILDATVRAILFNSVRTTVGFELDIAANTPDLLHGDPDRLIQILGNLTSNAFKFTKQGHVLLRVTMHDCHDGEVTVRFEVEDTGIGIAPDKLESIFQPFHQGDASTTREYSGTGLGLAISKQLIEHMRGTIGVESVLGEGSTFWFTAVFQTKTSTPHPLRLPRARTRDSEASPQDPQRRILVVEDNPINRRVAVALLSRLGCESDIALDGIEAVEAVKKRPYDLIFMDCQMPRMDGYAATAEIRKIPDVGRTPIVALTANAMNGDRERCLDAGMDDYLAKPVTSNQLREMLARWTGLPADPEV